MIKDFLALAALVMFASVSAEEIATDFPLDGPTAFSAAPGETKIYTGKISGTGPVIIDAGDPSIGRGGTVVFTNPANDYTGGTLISNAVFRVDADGAAGGDPISIVLGRQKVDGNWVNRGQLNVNCSSLANTINYLDRSPSDMECILLLSVPTTLSAIKMHLAKASGGFEACIRSCSSEGPSVIAGPVEVEHVSGSETVLTPYPAGGSIEFRGKITAEALQPGYSDCGPIRVYTSDNVLSKISLTYGYLCLHAVNAFPGAYVQVNNNLDGVYDRRDRIDLNGCSQSFAALVWSASAVYSVANRRSTAGSFVTGEGQPATLTLTGRKQVATHSTQFGLHGPLSLVIDADPVAYPGFCQDFRDRDVLTSGDITVARGGMSVSGYGNFPNVPNVTVGAEGTLTVSSTIDDRVIFASVTNLAVYGKLTVASPVAFSAADMALTLGPNALVTLPQSTSPYRFKELYVDDGTGNLTRLYGLQDLPQVPGVSVFGEGEGTVAATWTGAGASASVSDAGNWSWASSPELPPIGAGMIQAKFADGGTEAELDQDVYLNALDFAGTTDFRIFGDHLLTVKGGISLAGENRTYAIDVPTEVLQVEPQAYDVPSGTTLAYNGGLTDVCGVGTVVKSGDGTLAFGNGTEISRAIDVQRGWLKLSGSNAVTGVISVRNRDTGGNAPKAWLVLSNADVNASVTIYGHKREIAQMLYSQGETNVIRGRFELNYETEGGVIVGDPGSTLILTGGGNLSDKQVDFGRKGSSGTCRMVIRDTPLDAMRHNYGLLAAAGGVVRLDVANNGFKSGGMNGISFNNGGRYEFGCDNAVTNCKIWFYSNGIGTLDLLRSKQHFVCFDWANEADRQAKQRLYAFVTGEYGSEMGLERGETFHNYQGGVGLCKLGPTDTTLVFSNNTATSFGDIRVESGTLRFGDRGFWPNGTNVTVEAAGVLSLSTSATFGKFARMSVATGGKVQLDAGVTQRVRELTLGGVMRKDGTYGSSASSAQFKDDAYFTGTGVIDVRGGGMVLIVR